MKRILLVEDEQILRETYEIILSTQPYTVDIAVNGQDAFEKFQAHTYDLILLDIMMPIMDGLGFLEKINELGKELPKIILMTNLSGGKEIDQAMKLGAVDALLKSNLSPRQLIAAVRSEVESD
jgi:CheY-like chemotaxis protein